MPMILALALTAQTTTLTSDPLEAPKVCAVALTLASPDKPVLFRAASVSYLLTKRAAANTKGPPFFTQLMTLGNITAELPKLTADQANVLAPQCDKRYPQARRDGPVTLPSDTLARNGICLFALATMGGVVNALPDKDPAVVKRYEEGSQRFSARFDEGMAAKNLNEEAALALASKIVIDGLELGNAYVISEACLKLPV